MAKERNDVNRAKNKKKQRKKKTLIIFLRLRGAATWCIVLVD